MYQVISPDGLPLSSAAFYRTREQAEAALARWCQRFVVQGYYVSFNGHIALADLPARCTIRKV